ncbi:hypothetical protein ASPFODRAFT_53875 [Aspergillus luchuensis CBS 106.47]|uniref:Uncharacterized protein n=1 Tax=Aspergillus luchuensis (strain CBS 106.47) TaxID=1137211 RepID=A0A1M3T053_ASPLC|nr:hypothetical protein ASPFODRAFT_53875 [Aspergillus luchuensis CBS 106.47]
MLTGTVANIAYQEFLMQSSTASLGFLALKSSQSCGPENCRNVDDAEAIFKEQEKTWCAQTRGHVTWRHCEAMDAYLSDGTVSRTWRPISLLSALGIGLERFPARPLALRAIQAGC